MTTPRLQMKEPYRFSYDKVQNINVYRYMSEFGYIDGLVRAWKDYVQEMMDHFDAGLAANEGLEATIKELMPSRRHLTVSRLSPCRYIIECDEGGARASFSAGDDDSLTLCICSPDTSDAGSEIDLGCYDSAEAAAFIASAFKAYRDLNSRFVKAFVNS